MTAAVTFDAGQTLLRLDTAMLASRLGERGVTVEAAALESAEAPAWAAYERAVAQPPDGVSTWEVFMRTLLHGAAPSLPDAQVAELAAWLFSEQPRRNLWRRLMPGMIELVDELRAASVPVAVVSNSEGGLEALLAEIGVHDRFVAIADSARVGFEKPDPRIFDWAAARLGVARETIVHIGDSWQADVVGARNAGARAIWFGPAAVTPAVDPRVGAARDADTLRAVLVAWRVLPA
jgi:putative hydrolase of the HAD superfamily